MPYYLSVVENGKTLYGGPYGTMMKAEGIGQNHQRKNNATYKITFLRTIDYQKAKKILEHGEWEDAEKPLDDVLGRKRRLREI
jgi:hypothetical protein